MSQAHKKRKPLRRRQGQEGIGLRLDDSGFPTAVKQKGRKMLSKRQTMRMGELLGESQRLLTPPQGLHGIAQTPQCVGRIDKAMHPRRPAMAER
jgi:hypothetical protein